MLEFTLDLKAGRQALVRFTDRSEGDFADGAASPWRRVAAGGPWTRLRQQHGSEVVRVTAPGDGDGASGDAAVTSTSGAVLAVLTADCAPIALVAREGAVAVVHAGWRGLAAGVIDEAARALRMLGGETVSAFVGPCIGPECYEFGTSALDDLARQFGPGVCSRTAWGTPALDLPAAVRSALGRSGIGNVTDVARCTACESDRWFSHRARGETQRQALAVWISDR